MRSKLSYIPEFLKNMIRKTALYKRRAIKKKHIVMYSDVESILDEAPPLLLNVSFPKKPFVAIVKNQNIDIIEGYVNPKASWLRYERFCKNNDIPYNFYDITSSNWLNEVQQFDIIICHTESNPSYQEMIESKIYILEKILGKHCFPSYHEVWQYENKIRSNYLYQTYDLPSINTIITHNKEECFRIINDISYPYISKTTIGAGSTGVKKISSKREAYRMTSKIFGINGLKTQYPYQRQKDYFFAQDFIDDAKFDLRIMLIGNMAFGYYRYPVKGDFRASGSGIVEKKDIPKEALLLAISIKDKLSSRLLGVDLLFSKKLNKYLIIETSLFNQIDTPEQLVINNNPGYYDISDVSNITFNEGKFWIQELVIRHIIQEWLHRK